MLTPKYIFIDSNIYRGLFSPSEEFSDEFLQYIEKFVEKSGVKLLMPQQVKDEVERNCVSEWFLRYQQSLKNKSRRLDEKIIKLELDYKNYSKFALLKIKKDIQREKKKINENIAASRKQFLSPKSRSRVKLSKLIGMAQHITETEEIRQKAFFRREKGNPPKDKEHTLGDKLIWESLLFHLSTIKKSNSTLIFIARDNAAWKSSVDEKIEFNPWLQKEYKEVCRGKVILIESLSQLPGLTIPQQKKIKEKEEEEKKRNIIFELKNIVPDKFKTANTFADAEKLMRSIEPKINLLDPEAIEQILNASIENNNYSAGPYNQVLDSGYSSEFFYKLLCKSKEAGFNLKIWKDFYLLMDEDEQKRHYNLRKFLQESGIEFDIEELKCLDTEDIPF